jgi:hypothetical protein
MPSPEDEPADREQTARPNDWQLRDVRWDGTVVYTDPDGVQQKRPPSPLLTEIAQTHRDTPPPRYHGGLAQPPSPAPVKSSPSRPRVREKPVPRLKRSRSTPQPPDEPRRPPRHPADQDSTERRQERPDNAVRTNGTRALPTPDVPGHDQRPNPRKARTSAEFVEALRQFRIWAGNPSFRDMARNCDRQMGYSTMCAVLRKDELPRRLEVVEAIITGCGGSDEDRQRFATAWRRLAQKQLRTRI